MTTGPPSSDLARATWTDSGSGWKRKPSRFSQAVSRILFSRTSPSAVRLSQTITEESARCGMSACGKPPNTEAFSTWPVSSAWLAMPIRVFIGSREGVWTSELLMIGRLPHTILGLDLARERAHQGAAGAAGRVGHVDMRIGAVAGDDRSRP